LAARRPRADAAEGEPAPAGRARRQLAGRAGPQRQLARPQAEVDAGATAGVAQHLPEVLARAGLVLELARPAGRIDGVGQVAAVELVA